MQSATSSQCAIKGPMLFDGLDHRYIMSRHCYLVELGSTWFDSLREWENGNGCSSVLERGK